MSEVRDVLTFGLRRLKIVKWLTEHPEIDEPGYVGQMRFVCHHDHSVKATVELPPREIRVGDPPELSPFYS